MKENKINYALKDRVGKMYISEELLLTDNITEAFKVLDIRVIRAEYLIATRAYEYFFYSKFAEELVQGCNIPEYRMEVTKTDFDQLIYELKKC